MKQERPPAPFQPDPPGWQDSNLGKFLAYSDHNAREVYKAWPETWAMLVKLETVYDDLTSNLDGTGNIGPMLFLTRSHNVLQGALRLLVSTQCVEVHLLLRSMIEHCLCALYFRDHPEHLEHWRGRHDDRKNARQNAKDASKNGVMLRHLKSLDAELGEEAATLYDETIDQGAHPNPLGMAGSYLFVEGDEVPEHYTTSLTSDKTPYFRETVLRVLIVGMCCINIGRLAFPEESKRVDLTERLDELYDYGLAMAFDLGYVF